MTEYVTRKKKPPIDPADKAAASVENLQEVLREHNFPVPPNYLAKRLGASKRAVNSTLHNNQNIFRMHRLVVEEAKNWSTCLWGLHPTS